MEKRVPAIDIINGHATAETEGLYRVAYHNIRSERVRKICQDREFLSVEEAIQLAEIHNALSLYTEGKKITKRTVWAETVSYDKTEERWERETQRADHKEIATKARLSERMM